MTSIIIVFRLHKCARRRITTMIRNGNNNIISCRLLLLRCYCYFSFPADCLLHTIDVQLTAVTAATVFQRSYRGIPPRLLTMDDDTTLRVRLGVLNSSCGWIVPVLEAGFEPRQ